MANVFSMSPSNMENQREITNDPSEERHFLFRCK